MNRLAIATTLILALMVPSARANQAAVETTVETVSTLVKLTTEGSAGSQAAAKSALSALFQSTVNATAASPQAAAALINKAQDARSQANYLKVWLGSESKKLNDAQRSDLATAATAAHKAVDAGANVDFASAISAKDSRIVLASALQSFVASTASKVEPGQPKVQTFDASYKAGNYDPAVLAKDSITARINQERAELNKAKQDPTADAEAINDRLIDLADMQKLLEAALAADQELFNATKAHLIGSRIDRCRLEPEQFDLAWINRLLSILSESGATSIADAAARMDAALEKMFGAGGEGQPTPRQRRQGLGNKENCGIVGELVGAAGV